MRTPIPKRVLSFLMASLLVLGSISGDAFASSKIRIGVATVNDDGVYTVTFTADGVDGFPVEKQTEGGYLKELPADPEKEGFVFEGWYSGETRINLETEIAEDTAAAARFTEAEPASLFHVVFYDDEQLEVETLTVEAGAAIGSDIPALTERDGYDAHWGIAVRNGEGELVEADGQNAPVTADTVVDQDLDVLAVYVQRQHNVTFRNAEGETLKTFTVAEGETVSAEQIPDVEEQARAGYTVQWVNESYLDAQGNLIEGSERDAYVAGDTVVVGDIVVVPYYTRIYHTVTFLQSNGDVLQELSVAEGETIGEAIPAVPGREYFEASWVTGHVGTDGDNNPVFEEGEESGAVTSQTVVYEDLTAGPKYVQMNFTVRFYQSADSEPMTLEVPAGTGIGGNIPAPEEREGYDAHWAAGSFDAEGNPVRTGEEDITSATVVTGDLDVVAYYTKTVHTVTFYNRDALPHVVLHVEHGDAIGEQVPPVIGRDGYTASWKEGHFVTEANGDHTPVADGEEITADRIVTGDISVVPIYDWISYTVTFYDEDGETVLKENGEDLVRTVDQNTAYAVTDLPSVPEKPGYTARWMWVNADSETVPFIAGTAVTGDTGVRASYEKTIFHVTYLVEGAGYENNVYETGTYYSGDTLTLASAPVLEGKRFLGWYKDIENEETKMNGGEEVTEDLTLAAKFDGRYKVVFLAGQEDGTSTEVFSQYYDAGEPVGTLPAVPFKAGMDFVKWVVSGTDTEVTAETTVTGDMTVEAVFESIHSYTLTVRYWYKINENDTPEAGGVVFNTDIFTIRREDFPYTVTAPPSTVAQEIPSIPTYYPKDPTVSVEYQENTDEYKVDIEYVKHTAEYDYVYMLKNLSGDGYSEIGREHIFGVLGSRITPAVKEYEYAQYERLGQDVYDITQASGQELVVYYTRKAFTLSYDSNGGSYVPGSTVPYGTSAALPADADNPTRTGYTFAGWYSDEALTKRVTGSVTVNADTVLYAKWTGKSVKYTVMYMKEVYNPNGTNDWVYEKSDETKTGVVGTEITASSNAYAMSLNGYEKDTSDRNSSEAYNSKVKIAADGSTVLMVYYKLIRYTIVFNINRSTGKITIGGKTYTGSNYKMTNVVLGQDVSTMWPATSSEIYSSDRYFDGWTGASATYITKRYELIWDNVAKANSSHVMTFTASWDTTSYNRNAYYWQQQPDGSYKIADAYTQIGLNTNNLGAKNIDGYTKHNSDASSPNTSVYPKSGDQITAVTQSSSGSYVMDDNRIGGNSSTYYSFEGHLYRTRRKSGDSSLTRYNVTFTYSYNFYYDRTKYRIRWYEDIGAAQKTSSEIYFEADINNSTYNYVPAKPAGKSDYTWGGWYTDASLTTLYTFDTMPGHDLPLYGKWIAPTFTVSFVLGGGTGAAGQFDAKTLSKYEMAEDPGTPTRAGYTFEGWFVSEAPDADRYDWNNQITKDTVIYAHWTQEPISYTVRYLELTEDGSEGKALLDPKTVTNLSYEPGDVITELAMSISGFRPDAGSKNITLAFGNGNEITFYYSRKEEKSRYTVKYLLDPEDFGFSVPVAKERTEEVDGNMISVVETAAAVDPDVLSAAYDAHPELQRIQAEDLYPSETRKELILGADADQNVITFYYSRYQTAGIVVNYVDMNGEAIPGTETLSETLKIGKNFTLARKPVIGWELYRAVEGTSLDGTEAGTTYRITEGGKKTFTLFYQKKAVITALSANKPYDGTILAYEDTIEKKVSVEGLLAGDTLTGIDIQYTDGETQDGRTGRLNAGTAKTMPQNAVITGAAGHDGSSYYKIRYFSGKLEVTVVNVAVRIEPDRFTTDAATGAPNAYTGKAYAAGFTNPAKQFPDDYVSVSNEEYRELAMAGIAAGLLEACAGTVTVGSESRGYLLEQADVGDYGSGTGANIENHVRAHLPENPNYSVTLYVRDARLLIQPVKLAVTTPDGSGLYNGKPLTKEEGAEVRGAVNGETITLVVTGSQTDVGSSTNSYRLAFAGEEGAAPGTTARRTNYDTDSITENLGTLIVRQTPLRLTMQNVSVVYDGNSHSGADPDFGFTDGIAGNGADIRTEAFSLTGLADGDVLHVSYIRPEGVDAGTYSGTFDLAGWTVTRSVDGEEKDVTHNYSRIFTAGNLTINKAPLTIAANRQSYEFNNAPQGPRGTHTADSESLESYVTVTGLAKGDVLTGITLSGSRRWANVYEDDITPSKAEIGFGHETAKTAQDNYEIAYEKADLTIEQKNGKAVITKTWEKPASVDAPEISYTITNGTDSWTVVIAPGQTNAELNGLPMSGLTGLYTYTVKENAPEGYTAKPASRTFALTPSAGEAMVRFTNTIEEAPYAVEYYYMNSDGTTYPETASVTVTPERTGRTGSVVSVTAEDKADQENGRYTYDSAAPNVESAVLKADGTTTLKVYFKLYQMDVTVHHYLKGTTVKVMEDVQDKAVFGSAYTPSVYAETYQGKALTRDSHDPQVPVTILAEGNEITVYYTLPLTITAATAGKEYDGTPLNGSYTISGALEGSGADNSDIPAIQAALGTAPSITTAEESPEEYLTETDQAAIEGIPPYYVVTYVPGTLTISRKELTITAGSATKIYDGTPLTADSYTSGELAGGDSISSVAITGSQTTVGTSENVASDAVIVNAAGQDVTANYDITYEKGSLMVTRNQSVIITADSAQKVYDGTPLTKDSYQVSGLASGDRVESVTITGSQTTVGESDNVPEGAKIVNAAGADVTGSYEIAYAAGKLKVTAKAVTITAAGDTKTYDGTPLTNAGYTSTELAAGDSITSVAVEGSQTSAGTSDNAADAAVIKNAAGDDVTDSYSITYSKGTLTVTTKSLTITANGGSKVYDGTALTKDSYTSTDPADGDSIVSVTVAGSQTAVGKSDNTPSAAVIQNADGEDVTASYAITYTKGELEVTRKALTITAASDEKVYDGTALTADGYTATEPAAGDVISSVTVTGSQTEAGESANVPSAARIVNAQGEDVTGNYEISYENGRLAVTPKAVTITAEDAEKTYDGTALTSESYSHTELGAGDVIQSVTMTGSQTNAGSSSNVPADAIIVNASGDDVTSSYTISYENGTLKVAKRSVTITTGSAEKEYDGTPLTKDEVSISGLVSEETVTLTATGTITEPGNTPNTYAITWETASADNYTILEELGTLTVMANSGEVILTAPSAEKIYDGAPLTADGTGEEKVTAVGLPKGFTVEATASGSQTLAGSSGNVVNDGFVIRDAAGKDRTADFTNIRKVPGTLRVDPKLVTITANNAEKVYDSNPANPASFTASVEGLVDPADVIEFTVTREPGENVGEYVITPAGEELQGNYTVSFETGTFTIIPAVLTITAKDQSFVYSAEPQGENNNTYTASADISAKVTVEGLQGKDTLSSITLNGQETNAGEYDGRIIPGGAAVRTETGADATGNYEIVYTNGTLAIEKASLTITAKDQSFVYNAYAQGEDNHTYTDAAEIGAKVTVSGLQGSDSLTGIPLDGQAADAGVYEGRLVPGKAVVGDATDNYEITYASGRLTITKAPLTITAKDQNYIYNGTAQGEDNASYTASAEISQKVTAEGLQGSDVLTGIELNGQETNAGEYAGRLVPGAAEVGTAADNYDIAYVSGKLTITAREITVSVEDMTVEYNGSEQSGRADYAFANLVEGHQAAIGYTPAKGTLPGEYRNGTYANDLKILADGVDVTSNYDLTGKTAGKLTITDRAEKYAVTVTANSSTNNTYDGTEKSASGFETLEFTVDGNTYTVNGLTTSNPVSTDITPEGGLANEITGTALVRDASWNDVTDQFTVVTQDGTLIVKAREITVSVADTSAEYNGSEQYGLKDYVFTGLVPGHTAAIGYSPAHGTLVGTYANGSYEDNSLSILNAEGAAVTGNYVLKDQAAGKLAITDRSAMYEIEVAANSSTGNVYDGTEKKAEGFETLTFQVDGNTYTVEGLATSNPVSTDITPEGGLTNAISGTAKVLDAAGTDVTGQFSVSTKDGRLEILARDITASVADRTLEYNGSEQYGDTAVLFENVIDGQTAAIGYTPSKGTLPGTYDNGAYLDNLTIVSGGVDVTADYRLTAKTTGKLTITDRAEKYGITVTAKSNIGNIYDGTQKSAAGFETLTFEVEGNTYTVSGLTTSDPAGTDVAVLTNEISGTAVVLDVAGNDVTSQFNVNTENGTLEIRPREITVTAVGGSRQYNGTPLTAAETGYVITAGSLAEGQSETVVLSGEIILAGTQTAVVETVTILAGETDVTNNYTVTKENGTLQITENTSEIVVLPGSGEKIYDGTALTKNASADFTVTGVPEGFTWTAEADGTVTNAVPGEGEKAENKVTSFRIFNSAGEDVTDQFPNIAKSATGMLKILPIEIVLTADSAKKVYDGEALTQDSYQITTGAFIEGEGLESVTVEGSQTLAGSSANMITAHQLTPDTLAANYTISYLPGTLTVTDGTGPDDEEEVEDDLVVTKTVSDEQFALGAEVTFTITATNIYDEAATITLSEIEGVTLAQSVFENVAAGESIETTATYTITEADILQGSFTNTVTVEVGNITKTADAAAETEGKNAHLTITKESDVAEGAKVVLGQVITYTITVTNDGNVTISDIAVTDDLEGVSIAAGDGYRVNADGTVGIASLAPNTSVTITAIYTVTSDDILAGSVKNNAMATGSDPEGDEPVIVPGTEEDEPEDLDTTLSVNKKIANTPANGEAFTLGETIAYSITVKNEGNVPYYNVVVEDDLTGLSETIEVLAVGEERTFDTEYVVTEADILAGSVKNTATAKGDPIENPKDPENPKTPEGEDTEETGDGAPEPGDEGDPDGPNPPVEGKNAHLTITKESDVAEGAKVVLGQVITYTITVTNDGNVTISNIVVTDDLSEVVIAEGDGYTVNADGTVSIASLAPNTSAIITATYTVTSDDILAGSVKNNATAAGSDPEGSDPTIVPGTEEDEPDDLDTALSVDKKIANAPANGEAFTLGETIAYSITVKNEGNVPYYNVVVEDDLTGLNETIEVLAVGEEQIFDTEYAVTEADILAGSVKNTATAKGDPVEDPKDPENPKIPEGEDTEETGDGTPEHGDEGDPDGPNPPVEGKNAHLTITKESDVAEGAKAVLGQVINYTITVTNDGNVTISDIVVTDDLEGVSIAAGESYTVNEDGTVSIASLAPNTSTVITATYTVTSDDILAGSVKNNATAIGSDPEGDEPVIVPGTEEDEPDDLDTTLSVNKKIANTPANGEAFTLGETIAYTITVKNEGNVPYYNVVVDDDLTGLSETIEVLAIGEEQTFDTEYVVTEADILAGSVKNTATAKGDPIEDSKDPENPKIPEGEDTEETGDGTPETSDEDDPDGPNPPVEGKNAHLTITKTVTSTPANGAAYAAGEDITYNVAAFNDGNLTLTGITVTDELTGDSWNVESLAPGASENFTVSYTVSADDIMAGRVVNTATATGSDPDGSEPGVTPGTAEVPAGEPEGRLTITKTVTNRPSDKAGYVLGELITYRITAVNSGNTNLVNITVRDDLTRDRWNVETLAPGESRSFTTRYRVTQEDVDAGSVTNVATADAENANPNGGNPDDRNPDNPNDLDVTIEEGQTSSPTRKVEEEMISLTVIKVWEDDDNALGIRPATLQMTLASDAGSRIVTLSDANNWQAAVEVARYDEDGAEIDYTWIEPVIAGYQQTGLAEAGNTTTITNAVAELMGGSGLPDAEAEPEDFELTIYYRYQDGRTAAPTYMGINPEGSSYFVPSPEIPGYTASNSLVSGTQPGRNIERTVIYVPEDGSVIIEDYGMPLGLGSSFVNIGDCQD